MLSQSSAFPPLSESPLEVSDVRPQPIFFERYRAPRERELSFAHAYLDNLQ